MVDNALGGIEHTHNDIPCVADYEDGKGRLENPAEEHEADLLAALEAAGGELPACSCTEKCAPGAIHTDCEVCAVNMTECAGTAPEPAPVTEPAEEPEPEPQQKSNTGTLLLILAVAVLGSGAGWYFKIYRPKHEKAAVPEEDYSEELADYDDPEDDGPPWDEDDTESEDNE